MRNSPGEYFSRVPKDRNDLNSREKNLAVVDGHGFTCKARYLSCRNIYSNKREKVQKIMTKYPDQPSRII